MENNKTILDMAKEIKYISILINQDKFQEALERIKSYETQNPNDRNLQSNKLGFLVDIGFGLNDKNIIQQGLDIGEQILKNQKDIKFSYLIHFHLANGYLSLCGLTERKTSIEAIPQSENLQKAKLHFREALKLCEDFYIKPIFPR